MKKFLAIFAAVSVMAACTKKPAEEAPVEVPAVQEAAPEAAADAAPAAPQEEAASSSSEAAAK